MNSNSLEILVFLITSLTNLDQFNDHLEAHKYNFDQHGEYTHNMVATHTIIEKGEFFDIVEYNYNNHVDDFMD
jgi:hypothetical protein